MTRMRETEDDRETLSVGDAARLIGVSPGTLRLWESQGLIRPERNARGERSYGPDDVIRLRQIRLLRTVNKVNAAGIRRIISSGPDREMFEAVAQSEIAERAARLRSIRRQLALTLKEASSRSGLSISFISSVERAVAGASPSSIARLLEAYRSDGTRFHEDPAVQVRHPGEGRAIRSARVRDEWLSDRPGLLEPVLKTIEPGGTSEGIYEHEGEEFHYVLEGTLVLWLDGEKHELHTGDSIHFPSRVPHRWENPGDVATRMLGVTTEIGLWSAPRRLRDRWAPGAPLRPLRHRPEH